jgi:CRISPR-associated protein Cmr4
VCSSDLLTFGYDDDGVKGAVKTFFENRDDQDFSGALAFTDARLLLFPVKSYKGVFALVTCPRVLDKLYQELNFICNPKVSFSITADDFKILGDKVVLADENFLKITDKVILDEYAFGVNTSLSAKAKVVAQSLSDLTGQTEILKRLVVVPDDVYRDFTKLSTEVITRTKIQNDTGTVQSGALFTEEYLPAESYMYSLIAARRIFQTTKNKDNDDRQAQYPKNVTNTPIRSADDVLDFFKDQLSDVAQIGGSSTLGKGIVKLFKNQL